ncbi:MAG: hypothetical protein DMG42_07150 [Acidobacteria bacterium]|nr:MAG: hypothetical protein DMG42_07150 [Acidobacteriota bacterium]
MNAPGKLEKGLAIVLLLLSTGAFLNLFLKHGKFRFEANAGLPFMQVIWAGLYLFVLFFLIKEARGFWRLLLRGWPFLLLLAICLLSISWSDAKGLTARRVEPHFRGLSSRDFGRQPERAHERPFPRAQ